MQTGPIGRPERHGHSNFEQHTVSKSKLQNDFSKLQQEIFPFDIDNPPAGMKQKVEHFIHEAKTWAKNHPNDPWSSTVLDRANMLQHALKKEPIVWDMKFPDGTDFKMTLSPQDAFNRTFSNLQTSINDLTLIDPSNCLLTPYPNLHKG